MKVGCLETEISANLVRGMPFYFPLFLTFQLTLTRPIQAPHSGCIHQYGMCDSNCLRREWPFLSFDMLRERNRFFSCGVGKETGQAHVYDYTKIKPLLDRLFQTSATTTNKIVPCIVVVWR